MINVNEATTKFDSIIKLTMPVQDDLSLVHYVGFITQFNSIGRGWVVTCTCTCTCVVLAMFSKRNILVAFSSFFFLVSRQEKICSVMVLQLTLELCKSLMKPLWNGVTQEWPPFLAHTVSVYGNAIAYMH